MRLKNPPGNSTTLKYPSNLPSYLIHSFQPSAPHILTQLGRVHLKIGPHSFSKTKLWEVRPDHNTLPIGPKPGSQEEEEISKMNEKHLKKMREWKEDCDKRKLHWRKKNPDPRIVEKKKKSKWLALMKKGKGNNNNNTSNSNLTTSNSHSQSPSSNPASTSSNPSQPQSQSQTTMPPPTNPSTPSSIDPLLIQRVNFHAMSNPNLQDLLSAAASGRASADQLRTLGDWIGRITEEMKQEQRERERLNQLERNLQNPQNSGTGLQNQSINSQHQEPQGYVEKDKDVLENEARIWEAAKAEMESHLPPPPTFEMEDPIPPTISSSQQIPTPSSMTQASTSSNTNPSSNSNATHHDPMSFSALMSRSNSTSNSDSPTSVNPSSLGLGLNSYQNSPHDLSSSSTISPSDLMMNNNQSDASMTSNSTFPFPTASTSTSNSNPSQQLTSTPAITLSDAPNSRPNVKPQQQKQAVAWPQDFQPSPPLMILEFRESSTIRFWFPLWNCSVERRAILKPGNDPLEPTSEIPKARELRKREIRITMMLPCLGSEAASSSDPLEGMDFDGIGNGKEKEKSNLFESGNDSNRKSERYPATYLLRGEDFEEESGVSESVWDLFERCKIVKTLVRNPEVEIEAASSSAAAVQEVGNRERSKSPKKSQNLSRSKSFGGNGIVGAEDGIEAAIELGGNANWKVWDKSFVDDEDKQKSRGQMELETRERALKLGQKFADMVSRLIRFLVASVARHKEILFDCSLSTSFKLSSITIPQLQTLPTRRYPKYILPGPNSIPRGLEDHLSDKYAPKSRTLTGKPVPNAKNKMASINFGHYNDMKEKTALAVPSENNSKSKSISPSREEINPPNTIINAEGIVEKVRRKPGPKPGWKLKAKQQVGNPKAKIQEGGVDSSIPSTDNLRKRGSRNYHVGKWKGLGKGWRKGKSNEEADIKPNPNSSASPAPSSSTNMMSKKIKLNLGSNKDKRSTSRERSKSNHDFELIMPPLHTTSSPSRLKRKSSQTGSSPNAKKSLSSTSIPSGSNNSGSGNKFSSPTIIPHPTYHTKPTARQLAARNRLSSATAGEGDGSNQGEGGAAS